MFMKLSINLTSMDNTLPSCLWKYLARILRCERH